MGDTGDPTQMPPQRCGTDLPCVASAEVTDPASIKAATAKVEERLGGSGLTLLINNAGMAKPNSLDNETLENMSQVYTTNTIGPMLVGQVRPSPETGCPGGHDGLVGGGPASAPVRDGLSIDKKSMEPQAGAQEPEPSGLGRGEEEGGCSWRWCHVDAVEGAGPHPCATSLSLSLSSPGRRSCPCWRRLPRGAQARR